MAYIFYLVPRATGAAAAQSSHADAVGEARSLVKAIVPQWNACAYFAVMWHRVAEVLRHAAANQARISVEGWFRGAPLPRPPSARNVLPPLRALDAVGVELHAWLNHTYLAPDVQRQIRRHFVESDSVQLHDFLLPQRYEALVAALATWAPPTAASTTPTWRQQRS